MVTRRRFDREFKLQILQQAEHQPIDVLSREHNIHPNTITRWKREQRQYPTEAFKGKGNMYKLEAKLAEAQRIIGELYAENTLLKKAILSAQVRQAEERLLRSIK